MIVDGSLVIGINIGSSSTTASVYQIGRAELVPNNLGQYTTPSVVYFSPDNADIVVGAGAQKQRYNSPQNTIFGMKRLLGRSMHDAVVQHDLLNTFPFKIVPDESVSPPTPQIEIVHNYTTLLYTPIQILSLILTQIKQFCIDYLHDPEIKHVVLTVPSHFTIVQRNHLRIAIEFSGLECVKILHEHWSTFLTFQYTQLARLTPEELPLKLDESPVSFNFESFVDENDDDKKNIRYGLIYDFGGYALNLSVISYNCTNPLVSYQLLNNYYDPYIGGEQFTQVLVDYCCHEYNKKYNTDDTYQITSDARAIDRLTAQCEQLKTKLSVKETGHISIITSRGEEIVFEITQIQYTRLLTPFIQRTTTPIAPLLECVNLSVADINDVIITGGTTKFPTIPNALKRVFIKNKLVQFHVNFNNVNLDEVIGIGTGLAAALMSTSSLQSFNASNNASTSSNTSNGSSDKLHTRVFANYQQQVLNNDIMVSDQLTYNIGFKNDVGGDNTSGDNNTPQYSSFVPILSYGSAIPILNTIKFDFYTMLSNPETFDKFILLSQATQDMAKLYDIAHININNLLPSLQAYQLAAARHSGEENDSCVFDVSLRIRPNDQIMFKIFQHGVEYIGGYYDGFQIVYTVVNEYLVNENVQPHTPQHQPILPPQASHAPVAGFDDFDLDDMFDDVIGTNNTIIIPSKPNTTATSSSSSSRDNGNILVKSVQINTSLNTHNEPKGAVVIDFNGINDEFFCDILDEFNDSSHTVYTSYASTNNGNSKLLTTSSSTATKTANNGDLDDLFDDMGL